MPCKPCVHIPLVENVSRQPFEVIWHVLQVKRRDCCFRSADNVSKSRDNLQSSAALRPADDKGVLDLAGVVWNSRVDCFPIVESMKLQTPVVAALKRDVPSTIHDSTLAALSRSTLNRKMP